MIAPLHQRLVDGGYLLGDERDRPAVQQQVMMAPDQLAAPRVDPDQHQAHQRRLAQVEAPLAVGAQECIELRRAIRAIKAAPVELLPGQRHLAQHDLQRLVLRLPHKRGPQHVVMPQRPLPGTAQSRHVDVRQRDDQLRDIDPGTRVQQRMKQHPLLHRRQRIDSLEVRTGLADQAVQVVLSEIGRREVGGREPARFLVAQAMPDQAAQGLQKRLRLLLHALAPVQALAIGPVEPQLRARDQAVDLDHMRAARPRAAGGSRRLRLQRKQ
jgi:hypothetical protein